MGAQPLLPPLPEQESFKRQVCWWVYRQGVKDLPSPPSTSPFLCLSPLLQYGFNLVMSHPHAVNEIALSLNNKNPR